MKYTALYRSVFFLLFLVSGFSGLIYESIWTHYLKLFLGHSAYAQTVVLAIFMGAMAIGSWLSSRYSPRWKQVLLGYAIVEGIVGLCAIGFHSTFVAITEFSYNSIMPSLGSPELVTGYKWALAAIMILPQSILLGMTFPLMSAGLIRHFPGQTGYTLSMLYFTNSLGAAIGVLASGFVLIHSVGLPGTILTAGIINIVLAILVWALLRTPEMPAAKQPEVAAEAAQPMHQWHNLLLVTACITGLSSFIYEIDWIRMLSLVLGSSTHAFELMLSAFIFGLALGGFWIRRRLDAIQRPESFLGIVQVIMGLCALASLVIYGKSFQVMHWLLKALDITESSYTLFNISSHALALLVMLPTTFCAGMTLPLITFALFRRGYGEKSIGVIYASNTLGAIAGVLIAVHVGLPLLGIKNLMVVGATLDIGLGAALIWMTIPSPKKTRLIHMAFPAIGMAAVLATVLFVSLNSLDMASGVYRSESLPNSNSSQVLYTRDGKTATVAVVQFGEFLSISTNGKVDASVNARNPKRPAGDESTVLLLGSLPAMYFPQAKTAAVIGFGSGITTHTLLAFPALERVDTIEIEPVMVEGARSFQGRNTRAYSDPRSAIHIDDAKSFFSTQNRQYDIIVSEPSNPWVSGVSGLFSEEFYRHIKKHLTNQGVLVQWLQLYEINLDLVTTVIKALNSAFPDYVMYQSNNGDLLILATRNGSVGEPDYEALKNPLLSGEFKRVGIETVQDLELRRIGHKRIVNELMATSGTHANSDYFPVLDQNAARTRFMRAYVTELTHAGIYGLPITEMLGEKYHARSKTSSHYYEHLSVTEKTRQAEVLRDYFLGDHASSTIQSLPIPLRQNAELVKQLLSTNCARLASSPNWRDALHSVYGVINPYLTTSELRQIRQFLGADACRLSATPLQYSWLQLYQATGDRQGTQMAKIATRLLAEDRQSSPEQHVYLLASGMLGHLASNQHEASLQLFSRHSAEIANRGISSNLLMWLFRLSKALETQHR